MDGCNQEEKMKNTPFDVACIGIAVADILAKPVKNTALEIDTSIMTTIEVESGGDALNEACVFASYGVPTCLVGKTGNDDFGQLLLKKIRARGVSTEMCVLSDAPTSIAIVLIKETGERTFLVLPGAGFSVSLEDIDLARLAQAKAVTIGSFYALHNLDKGGALELLRQLKQMAPGVITAADTTHDSLGLGPKVVFDCLPYLDYFFTSYVEAVALTSRTEPAEMAAFLKDQGARSVVIKLGGRGCYLSAPEFTGSVLPYEVEAVDTTGAGDVFTASFMTAVLEGKSSVECARFANAAGAVNVTCIGATKGIRSKEQIMSFMREHPDGAKAIGQ